MLADLLHNLRRWWWGHFGVRRPDLCIDCGQSLTADEREHYETNCERCEGIFCRKWDEVDPRLVGNRPWIRCRNAGREGRKP